MLIQRKAKSPNIQCETFFKHTHTAPKITVYVKPLLPPYMSKVQLPLPGPPLARQIHELKVKQHKHGKNVLTVCFCLCVRPVLKQIPSR